MTTPPPIMCVVCSTQAVADRPVDPAPPHDPLSTDGVALRNGKLLCQYHATQFDNVTQTGGTAH
jgi:hypothetical protein